MQENRYHTVKDGYLRNIFNDWDGLWRTLTRLPSWMGVGLERLRIIDTETRDLSAVCDVSVPLHYTGVANISDGTYAVYDGLAPYEEDAIYVCHNCKFDVPVLRLRGFPIKPGQYIDTQLLAYEWDSTQVGEYSLDTQASKLGQPKLDLRQSLIDAGVMSKDAIPGWEYRIKTEQMQDYLVQDLVSTLAVLVQYLELYSTDEQGWYYYNSIALPYAEPLMEAESGLFIDTSKLSTVQTQLEELQAQREAVVRSMLPESVSVTRTKKGEKVVVTEKADIKNAHIAAILQDSGVELSYTAKGNIQLDRAALEDVEHPLAAAVLEYREVEKLTTTFVSGISNATDKCGVLRPNFCATCTATGRLSSSSPNVQNISTRTELGKVLREVFAAPPGWSMSVADLDRIEAVLLGWWMQEYQGDAALADVFRLGTDLHQVNADNWNVERFIAKTVLYLLMYGGGPQRLSVAASITLEEAQEVFKSIEEGQPALPMLKKMLIAVARRDDGVLHDPLGRRYIVHGLDSKDWKVRGKAERRVFSFINQGFAASIFKELQIRVWLYRHQLGWQDHSKQILAVHDEGAYLVRDWLVEVWDKTMSQVYTDHEMLTSQAGHAPIPVSGEFNHSHNWRYAK